MKLPFIRRELEPSSPHAQAGRNVQKAFISRGWTGVEVLKTKAGEPAIVRVPYNENQTHEDFRDAMHKAGFRMPILLGLAATKSSRHFKAGEVEVKPVFKFAGNSELGRLTHLEVHIHPK